MRRILHVIYHRVSVCKAGSISHHQCVVLPPDSTKPCLTMWIVLKNVRPSIRMHHQGANKIDSLGRFDADPRYRYECFRGLKQDIRCATSSHAQQTCARMTYFETATMSMNPITLPRCHATGLGDEDCLQTNNRL